MYLLRVFLALLEILWLNHLTDLFASLRRVVLKNPENYVESGNEDKFVVMQNEFQIRIRFATRVQFWGLCNVMKARRIDLFCRFDFGVWTHNYNDGKVVIRVVGGCALWVKDPLHLFLFIVTCNLFLLLQRTMFTMESEYNINSGMQWWEKMLHNGIVSLDSV